MSLALYYHYLNGNKVVAGSANSCIQHANHLLDEAIGLMQKHYYKRESVQWDSLILAARDRLNKSGNCQDAYESVKWCFAQMHEPHSFIMSPTRAAEYNGNINSGAAPAKVTGGIRNELIENEMLFIFRLLYLFSF